MKTLCRVFVSELSIKDSLSLLILIGIAIISYLMLPTIIGNIEVIGYITTLYNEHRFLYVTGLIFLSSIFVFLTYSLIKVVYIHKFKDYVYRDEMMSKYAEFLKDAKQIWLFAGDLDFLDDSPVQYNLIKQLGSKCKILCERVDKNCKENTVAPIYKSLKDSKVQIRCYPTELNEKICTFRGQIRSCDDAILEHLFMKQDKKTKKFYPFDIDNQFITELIRDKFEDNFKNGINPLITHIVFDLGGVYFDGDFNEDFIKIINKKYQFGIVYIRENKLMLDEELNLGKKTIVQWVQSKINTKLTDSQITDIEDIWSKVWSPNSKMQDLTNRLAKHYTICVASNLDKQNGDMYIENNYLSGFSNNLFLSYKMNCLKPEKDFYNKMIADLSIKPYQILFIDDHEKNITNASSLDIVTIKFSISEGIKTLENKLNNLNINLT